MNIDQRESYKQMLGELLLDAMFVRPDVLRALDDLGETFAAVRVERNEKRRIILANKFSEKRSRVIALIQKNS